MSCVSQAVGCLYYALERFGECLGLYEPEISLGKAQNRLRLESEFWKEYQKDRKLFWSGFQSGNVTTGHSPSLVEKAIVHLRRDLICKGVAVDLGCGINSTMFNLLNQGWKVYAVDSSNEVLETLAQKVSSIGKSWIRDGQLILIKQSIETFIFPERVHLVMAIDSLPYCDPEKISKIFLDVRHSLFPKGVFVFSLFPYTKTRGDDMLRMVFGAWLTTKNVVEAVMRSSEFSLWSVNDGASHSGLSRQIHVFAQL